MCGRVRVRVMSGLPVEPGAIGQVARPSLVAAATAAAAAAAAASVTLALVAPPLTIAPPRPCPPTARLLGLLSSELAQLKPVADGRDVEGSGRACAGSR